MAIGGGPGRGTYWGGLSDAGHVIDGPRPFVVFNPTAWPRTELVRATVWDADTGPAGGDLKQKEFVVRAKGGKVVPAQKVNTGDYWGHKFVDLVFPAEAAPLGYTTYAIQEGKVEGYTAAVKEAVPPSRHEPFYGALPALENEFLRVAFDPATGGLVQMLDKASGKDLADPANPLGVLEYVVERPWGMSAWVIAEAKERHYPLPVQSLRHTQKGPHQAVIEAKLKIVGSDVTVTYTLKAGQPWLEIGIQVHWVEIGTKEAGVPNS